MRWVVSETRLSDHQGSKLGWLGHPVCPMKTPPFLHTPSLCHCVTLQAGTAEEASPLLSTKEETARKAPFSLPLSLSQAVAVTFVVSDCERLSTLMEGGNKGR